MVHKWEEIGVVWGSLQNDRFIIIIWIVLKTVRHSKKSRRNI